MTSFWAQRAQAECYMTCFPNEKWKAVLGSVHRTLFSQNSRGICLQRKHCEVSQGRKRNLALISTKKVEKIESNRSSKEDLLEVSGDSSSDVEHVETEKAECFKSLPASVCKMKAESSDSSKKWRRLQEKANTAVKHLRHLR